MNVCIKSIPHAEQRYATCGDWYYHGDTLQIRVSKMSDWRYEFLIALHELTEALFCKYAGITQHHVDKFDLAFEKRRRQNNYDEPGDARRAPYRLQHCLATGFERIAAAFLNVCWTDYETELNEL